MSSKRKTSRKKHSAEIITIILIMKSFEKSHFEIVDHLNIIKSSIIIIIHRHQRQSQSFLRVIKRTDRFLKLMTREQRRLICHVDNNSHENFVALTISFKSGKKIHRETARKYLKNVSIFCFKTRFKSYFTAKHKAARYRWAQDHKN